MPSGSSGRIREVPKPDLLNQTSLRATELCDGHPAVGAAERRRDGDDHWVDQLVPTQQRIARVFRHAEGAHKRGISVRCGYCRSPIRMKVLRIVARI